MDASRKRPISITIIAWVFITAGIAGLLYHANDFKPGVPFQFEVLGIHVVRVLAIIGGTQLLRGKNWSRWLLLLWLVYHAVLSVFHSGAELIMHFLLLVVIGGFLFRPAVAPFFRTDDRDSKERNLPVQ